MGEDLHIWSVANPSNCESGKLTPSSIDPIRSSHFQLDAISQLAAARRAAEELDCDVWQFAIELPCLLKGGASKTDLRWIVGNGLAYHGCELTLLGAPERSFQRTTCLQFTDQSCFVLSDLGQSEYLELAANDSALIPEKRPIWNSETRELSFDGAVVKRFRRPAPNQESVLAAFEEDSWPSRIDDPLSPQDGKEAKPRLHDTINALNRNQRTRLLRFSGDGTGEGVRWEVREMPANAD